MPEDDEFGIVLEEPQVGITNESYSSDDEKPSIDRKMVALKQTEAVSKKPRLTGIPAKGLIEEGCGNRN